MKKKDKRFQNVTSVFEKFEKVQHQNTLGKQGSLQIRSRKVTIATEETEEYVLYPKKFIEDLFSKVSQLEKLQQQSEQKQTKYAQVLQNELKSWKQENQELKEEILKLEEQLMEVRNQGRKLKQKLRPAGKKGKKYCLDVKGEKQNTGYEFNYGKKADDLKQTSLYVGNYKSPQNSQSNPFFQIQNFIRRSPRVTDDEYYNSDRQEVTHLHSRLRFEGKNSQNSKTWGRNGHSDRITFNRSSCKSYSKSVKSKLFVK